MKISRLITAAALSVGMLSGVIATAGAASAVTTGAGRSEVPVTVPGCPCDGNVSPVIYGVLQAGGLLGGNATPAWTHAARRPAQLVLASDGGFWVSGIDWSNMSYQGTKLQWWGPNSAEGFGTVHINECVPNCARSHKYITLTGSIISMWRVRYHYSNADRVGQPYYTCLEVWGMNDAGTRYWDVKFSLGARGIGRDYYSVWGQPLNGPLNHTMQVRQAVR